MLLYYVNMYNNYHFQIVIHPVIEDRNYILIARISIYIHDANVIHSKINIMYVSHFMKKKGLPQATSYIIKVYLKIITI